MPVIFGRSLGAWVVAIIGAVLIFLVVEWLLPLLFVALGIPVPDRIITILALLCAAVVLFGPSWWSWRPTS